MRAPQLAQLTQISFGLFSDVPWLTSDSEALQVIKMHLSRIIDTPL